MALIAPILVTAVVCTVDWAMAIYTTMEMRAAAEAGALYAAANPTTYTSTTVANAVQSANAPAVNATVTVTTVYACVNGFGSSATMGAQQNASFSCPANYNTPTSGKYVNIQVAPSASSFTAIFAASGASVPTVTYIMRVQ